VHLRQWRQAVEERVASDSSRLSRECERRESQARARARTRAEAQGQGAGGNGRPAGAAGKMQALWAEEGAPTRQCSDEPSSPASPKPKKLGRHCGAASRWWDQRANGATLAPRKRRWRGPPSRPENDVGQPAERTRRAAPANAVKPGMHSVGCETAIRSGKSSATGRRSSSARVTSTKYSRGLSPGAMPRDTIVSMLAIRSPPKSTAKNGMRAMGIDSFETCWRRVRMAVKDLLRTEPQRWDPRKFLPTQ
jgi:hypothetical protein